MTNLIVRQSTENNETTKLYKRPDNTFFIVKRNKEGKILKSKINISFSDNSITNEINALNLFSNF